MENRPRTSAGEYRPILGVRYVRALAAVVTVGVFFTITDFVTSFMALKAGFSEGNSLLTALSAALNLDVIDSLIVTKLVFIAGMLALGLVGLKSEDRSTKRIMLTSSTVFMILFACVSLNNLYWITSPS